MDDIVLRKNASERLHAKLTDLISTVYANWREEQNITNRVYDQPAIIDAIADEQTDLGTDEFLDDYPKLGSIDEINTAVDEYVAENYDDYFIVNRIESEYDFESAENVARDELIGLLRNTSPYNQVDMSFWQEQIGNIASRLTLYDLATYADDGADRFVEVEVPDWQEMSAEYGY